MIDEPGQNNQQAWAKIINIQKTQFKLIMGYHWLLLVVPHWCQLVYTGAPVLPIKG